MKTLVRVLVLSAAFAGAFVLARKHNYLRPIVRLFIPAVELGKYRDPTIEGAQDYQDEAAKFLEQKNYDALEERAREALANKEQFSNGRWKLSIFYESFGPADHTSESAWLARLQQLNGWILARPNSGPAHIALAEFYTDYAWRARGAGWARTVTQQGGELFRLRLNLASQVLERGRNFAARDPGYWNAYQTIAMGLSWPRFRQDEILRNGLSVAPYYVPLYTSYAYTITPRWGGQPGQIKILADRAVQVPGGPGEEAYAWIAFQMDQISEDPARLVGLDWPKVESACLKLLEKYPNEPSIISRFAMLAVRYGDSTLARKLFEDLDDRVDMRVWESVDEYKKHYNHVHPNAKK
jgi:hypothetical protein